VFVKSLVAALLFTLFGTGILFGCAQQDENRFKEKAQTEESAKTKADIDALSVRAREMERDLRNRYRFYNGISHTYVGSFDISGNTYKLKMTLTPTFFLPETERVRTLEEIQQDLNSLFLIAQVTVWDDKSGFGASGCTFENIRPDLRSGKANLISADCVLSFAFTITTPTTSISDRDVTAVILATSLREGKSNTIESLNVGVTSRLNPNGYEVLVSRAP
jgi:hypothetical protein